MKDDSLNQFIRENREAFDSRTPSDKVWQRVSGHVFMHPLGRWWQSAALWRAAAMIMFGVSAFLFYSRPAVPIEKRGGSAQQEFGDVESYYATQISEKTALITHEGLFADDSFTQDLQKLEAMYSVLYDEMKREPSEKVKDALVLNMLVRIDLLNQQIQKLEESKRSAPKRSSI
jgi:hypothetical protein